MMTVKAQRGRRRYIAFDVSPGTTAESLARGLPRGRFKVIQCAGGMAIVRCPDGETEACIAAVRTADPGSVSRRTSGTLRTLRDRYSVLRENAPPRPPRKGTKPPQIRQEGTSADVSADDSIKTKY